MEKPNFEKKWYLLPMNLTSVITFLIMLFACNKSDGQISENNSPPNNVGSTLSNIDSAEFTLVEITIDNKICFALINESFNDYKHKNTFPYSLWVTVETKKKTINGHPTSEEATLFNTFEDELLNKLASKTPFCYIGRTTRDGFREIMLYVSNKQRASEIMNDFIKVDSSKRKITYEISLDEKWKSISGLYKKDNQRNK